MSLNGPSQHEQTVIRVYLVNGDARSISFNERNDVTDLIRYMLHKIRMNLEVSLQLFGMVLKHIHSNEAYWLQPGVVVQEQLNEYCATRPLEEWKFLLRIRVLPKTPQHLLSQDPVAFQYFYDQVFHMYLEDESIVVDNETGVKLGCLELRRFYKDMPQIALKRKENFTMLEREIGLEKFFKKSMIAALRKKNLRTMVLSAFQQYESLTMEGCIFQFFNLLSKHTHSLDTERFSNCAIGDDQAAPLTYEIFVGPNSDIEFKPEGGNQKFLAAFNDIQDILYEPELMSRGRVLLQTKNCLAPIIIRTALLVTAVDLATLIDGYCMVYTQSPHSRMALGKKRYSNSSRFSGLYSIADDDRFRSAGVIDPYLVFKKHSDFSGSEDYSEIRDPRSPLLGKAISPREVILGEKIGEGQFGDVHKGILYPNGQDESMVAIKTCKPDASMEERTKFLEEAAVMRQFNHHHIIKLFGVMSHESTTYIIMELAPLGQLRRYLLTEGSRISKTMLLEYIRQLASAMVHLESKNYVHRDIAARNVLVSNPDTIQLSDFGLSRGLEDGDYYVASRGKLPIKWMAPESINFRRFTGLSDVWMFGVCCWEILMRGVKPFVGIKNDEVISKIELGERLPLPPECPAPLFRLMNMCWQYDPQDRPTFSVVEQAIEEVVAEEKQLDLLTQRRVYAGIQRDPNAPEKPWRPPSSQRKTPSDTHLKRYSALSTEDELQQKRLSENMEEREEDNALPLPPRLASRFRDLSMSPQSDRVSPPSTGSDTPPPKPPRRFPQTRTGNNLDRIDQEDEERYNHAPPLPIVPYSVTTITPLDIERPHITSGMRRSESPIPSISMPIPPPSIIKQPRRESANSMGASAGVYYSTVPAEIGEGGPSRTLSEEGVFVDQESHSSLESGRLGLHLGDGRPLSHISTEDSSPRSSPVFDDRHDDSFQIPEDDPIIQQTTVVVKSVMELSNKVPLSRPNDYVELVKKVGMALRDLMGKVDTLLKELPEQTHHEVSMAHKVLSSDMSHLVEAMKNAQKHYQTFLEQEYQKQMLHSAHIVAMNSKQLLDAANVARRKAHFMQQR